MYSVRWHHTLELYQNLLLDVSTSPVNNGKTHVAAFGVHPDHCNGLEVCRETFHTEPSRQQRCMDVDSGNVRRGKLTTGVLPTIKLARLSRRHSPQLSPEEPAEKVFRGPMRSNYGS